MVINCHHWKNTERKQVSSMLDKTNDKVADSEVMSLGSCGIEGERMNQKDWNYMAVIK